MVEEVTTLNRGLNSRTMEGNIRKGIQKQCRQVFLFSSSIFKGW
jgi:hypothetical protein